jgi:hypothetical protein
MTRHERTKRGRISGKPALMRCVKPRTRSKRRSALPGERSTWRWCERSKRWHSLPWPKRLAEVYPAKQIDETAIAYQ